METQIQVGDNVGDLILFLHQSAVRNLEVHTTRFVRNEVGESMVDCIGQIIRWSKD